MEKQINFCLRKENDLTSDNLLLPKFLHSHYGFKQEIVQRIWLVKLVNCISANTIMLHTSNNIFLFNYA